MATSSCVKKEFPPVVLRDDALLHSWRLVANAEGLASDVDVARFLLSR
jgi:hypothetical protein